MKEGGPTLVKNGAGNCKIEPALYFNISAQGKVYSIESDSYLKSHLDIFMCCSKGNGLV